MKRPLLLDLYCCQGGASKGYADAGWDVIGVDMQAQPRYPYLFKRDDALLTLRALLSGWRMYVSLPSAPGDVRVIGLDSIDAIHASPPCQARTKAQKIQGNTHPNLIAPTRELILETGLPYVIENVVPEDAASDPDPLVDPVMLCGAMFGIETYRHRLFETNFDLTVPAHPEHRVRTTKMGRRPIEGEYMHIVGNFTNPERARQIMGMPWASRDGLREAIPPVYSEHIGLQMMAHLARAKEAA